jgi:alpha-galactosidase
LTPRDVGEATLGPRARVYEHGWQSWTPTGVYPAGGTSPRPPSPRSHRMHYRPDTTLPERGFQAAGLLAFDPGDGGPIRVWSAPDPSREVPNIRAVGEDGTLRISSDGDVTETSHATDLWAALAEWADALARRAGVQSIRPVEPGWCTWYQYFKDVTEDHVLENLASMSRLDLGVAVVQIDDGYQVEIGDWLDRSPRFPRPLEELAGRIRSEGRRAGIWTAPLLVGSRSKLAAEHPDWLVGDADAGHNWDQPLGALDVTHPDAAAHLQHVFRTLTDWGFDYFKIDFVYAGALDGRRRSDSTGLAAYREAVRLIREAIGPQATLLGCGAPILPSVGLYDAMRISPDVGPLYEPRDGDLGAPSQLSAVHTGRARAFQHGRFWVNDPDCLIVRPDVERREEWAEHVERFGGLRASSDRLESLDSWGLEVTRRLLRPSATEPFELSSLPTA